MEQKLVKLKAPKHATTVGSAYGPYSIVGGFVIVPEGLAQELLKPYHGFTLAPDEEIEPRKILHLKK